MLCSLELSFPTESRHYCCEKILKLFTGGYEFTCLLTAHNSAFNFVFKFPHVLFLDSDLFRILYQTTAIHVKIRDRTLTQYSMKNLWRPLKVDNDLVFRVHVRALPFRTDRMVAFIILTCPDL